MEIANEPIRQIAPASTDEGTPYRFELVNNSGHRYYAHTWTDLYTELSPPYGDMTVDEQWQMRLHHATSAQVHVQAFVNVSYPFDECSVAAQFVLSTGRSTQPPITCWEEPVPLVLLAHAYSPAGMLPKPEVGDTAEIWWIDPSDEESLLTSLHDVGYLSVNMHENNYALS